LHTATMSIATGRCRRLTPTDGPATELPSPFQLISGYAHHCSRKRMKQDKNVPGKVIFLGLWKNAKT